MKAIVYTQFGPPEVLQVKDVEKPAPTAREVLIKVYATTVVKEDPDWRRSPGFNGLLKPRKQILGQEFAGVIETVGAEVTRFRPGDAVYGIGAFGAYAEYLTIAEDRALVLKPGNLSYEEAASIPNGALTALPFLRDTGSIQPGQRVLIYGASGSVGTAAVQLAKYFGATVTGVCSAGNLELVSGLGADHVIDYTREDFTSHGKTHDLIFDTVGRCSFGKCRQALAEHGIYLTTVPSLGVIVRVLLRVKDRGRRVGFTAAGLRSASAKVKDLTFLNALIEAGRFRPVVDRCYPLAQMPEAHHYVEKGHKKGNVVIQVA